MTPRYFTESDMCSLFSRNMGPLNSATLYFLVKTATSVFSRFTVSPDASHQSSTWQSAVLASPIRGFECPPPPPPPPRKGSQSHPHTLGHKSPLLSAYRGAHSPRGTTAIFRFKFKEIQFLLIRDIL